MKWPGQWVDTDLDTESRPHRNQIKLTRKKVEKSKVSFSVTPSLFPLISYAAFDFILWLNLIDNNKIIIS
jgi:nitrate reductase NapE component